MHLASPHCLWWMIHFRGWWWLVRSVLTREAEYIIHCTSTPRHLSLLFARANLFCERTRHSQKTPCVEYACSTRLTVSRVRVSVGGGLSADNVSTDRSICARTPPTTNSAPTVAKRSLSSSLRDTTRENRRLATHNSFLEDPLADHLKVLSDLDVPLSSAEDVQPVYESLYQACNTKDRHLCLKTVSERRPLADRFLSYFRQRI
jgi:hypothetical protein